MIRKLLTSRRTNKSPFEKLPKTGKKEKKKSRISRLRGKSIRKSAKDNDEEYDADTTRLTTLVPSLTLTLSEDSLLEHEQEQLCQPAVSPKAQQIATYIFTEQEIMTNELGHQRQLLLKQQEIDKMQVVLVELKETLSEREEELKETKQELQEVEEELADVYEECASIEHELVETKTELSETKDRLNTIGSTLVQTQHELYEQSTESKRFFFWK